MQVIRTKRFSAERGALVVLSPFNTERATKVNIENAKRGVLVGIAAVVSMLVAGTSAATGTTSVTTIFGPGSTIGAQPDASVLGGLEAVANFGGPNLDRDLLGGTPNIGETLFIQSGTYYVGNAINPTSAGSTSGNNRAYGFFGTGRSDITFTPGSVVDITLQARGSSGGNPVGPNSVSLPPGSVLEDADATLLVYTQLGLQLSLELPNSGFQTLALTLGTIIDGQTLLGDSISRISLINEGPANSGIFLGEITAQVVPEPGTALLFGLGLAGLASLRRA